MNEINMVPFIDVMLVLLIIFMVSAPLITTGVVDLPSVGQAKRQPDHVIEVVVEADGRLKLRLDQGESRMLALGQLADQVRLAQKGDNTTPVIISADKGVKYEAVVAVMSKLQAAGMQRVGLAVKQGG
jgi:biopolymer transport protein TolR